MTGGHRLTGGMSEATRHAAVDKPPVRGPARVRPVARAPYVLGIAYLLLAYVRPHEFAHWLDDVPILPIVLVLALVAWMAGSPRPLRVPQVPAGIGLLVAIAVSVAASGWAGGAVTMTLDFLPILLVAALIASCTDTLSRLRGLMVLFVCVGIVLVAHGIEQSIHGVGWTGAKPVEDGRITYLGFMNDPNDLARVFVITIPFALHLAVRSTSKIVKVVCVAALPLLFHGIVLTNSRGAFLAVIALVALMVARRHGWLKASMLAPPLVAGLLILAPSRMDDLSADEDSAAGRVEAWYAGFEMLKEHPLFGVGKGGFVDHHVLTAHNSFVLAYAELGLFGYFFWLAIVIATFRMLRELIGATDPARRGASQHGAADGNEAERVEINALARTLFGSYVGLTVTSLFLSRSYELTLFVMIGLVMALYLTATTVVPGLQLRRLRDIAPQVLAWVAGTIVFFWLVTRILLQYG